MEPILLKKWTSSVLPISNENQGLMLGYDKTLNKIQVDNVVPEKIYSMRKAAEIHRQVRRYLQSVIKPGISFVDICDAVESKTIELAGEDNMYAGKGFPTGISINNIVAHDSAYPTDERCLGENDVCKIDFGTHVNGYIIDSAFTVAYNPQYEQLLKASQESMWGAIKLAGPDAHMNDLAQEIKDIIESYEVDIDGKLYPIKPVWNLGGHNIEQYKIHAGKLILNSPHPALENMRMNEGECYAIETFATTGTGQTENGVGEATHYGIDYLNPRWNSINIGNSQAKKLLKHIQKRSTLPFCTRWLDNEYGKFIGPLDLLVNKKVIQEYPPLVDKLGSYSAQWEHTLYLHEFGKEILSHGDDY
jgi:methionyl aminopeptidase